MGTIGDRIRELRIKAGHTQAELGQMLDKKDSTVRMWELSKSRPDSDTIRDLSRIYRVSADFLIGTNCVVECSDCGYSYATGQQDEIKAHEAYHVKVMDAKQRFGCYLTYTDREAVYTRLTGYAAAKSDERMNLALDDLRAQFSLSLEASGFDPLHEGFWKYAKKQLTQSALRLKYADIFDRLKDTIDEQLAKEPSRHTISLRDVAESGYDSDVMAIAREAMHLSQRDREWVLKIIRTTIEEAFSDGKPLT